MSRLSTAAHCLLPLLPGLSLAAQTEEVTLKIETIDRYQHRHQRILTGILLEPQAQCIHIRTNRQVERCIPVDSIRKVSVSVGRRRDVRRATLAGGAIGAALEVLIGAVSGSQCEETGLFNFQCGAGSGAVFGGFGGYLLGASIGGIVGAISSPSPIWRETDPAALTRRRPARPLMRVGFQTKF